MKRLTIRVFLAGALVGAGWAAGRAQEPLPDFELVIDAPEGRTNIECVRGCQGLARVERSVPGTVPVPRTTTFWFACSNSASERCGSSRIAGPLKR